MLILRCAPGLLFWPQLKTRSAAADALHSVHGELAQASNPVKFPASTCVVCMRAQP